MMNVPCDNPERQPQLTPAAVSLFFLIVLTIFSILAITFEPTAASPADKNLPPAVPAAHTVSPEGLLALAIERCRNLESYQCRLKLHVTRGDRVQNGEYKFWFKKPKLVRMQVENGKDKGSTIILRSDGRIRGRREGVLSIFVVTLNPGDQRLYDLWNRPFSSSDWVTLLSETQERLKKLEPQNLQITDDGQRILVDAAGGDFEEQTWLDRKTFVLLRKQARMKNGDYLNAVWSDIALNPSLKDQFFYF